MGNAFRIGLRLTEGEPVEDSYKTHLAPFTAVRRGVFRPFLLSPAGDDSEAERAVASRRPPGQPTVDKKNHPKKENHRNGK
jgi:hypothetical protein